MTPITRGSPPATPNPSRAVGTHYTVLAHVLAQRLRALLRAPHTFAVSDEATAVRTTPPEPSASKPSSHANAIPSRGLRSSAPFFPLFALFKFGREHDGDCLQACPRHPFCGQHHALLRSFGPLLSIISAGRAKSFV